MWRTLLRKRRSIYWQRWFPNNGEIRRHCTGCCTRSCLDTLNNDSYKTGIFCGIEHSALSGTLTGPGIFFADLNNMNDQDNAYQAIHRFVRSFLVKNWVKAASRRRGRRQCQGIKLSFALETRYTLIHQRLPLARWVHCLL